MATACASVNPSSFNRCTNLSVSKWWSFNLGAVAWNARLGTTAAAAAADLGGIGLRAPPSIDDAGLAQPDIAADRLLLLV